MIKTRIDKDANYFAMYNEKYDETFRFMLEDDIPMLKPKYPEFIDISFTSQCHANCPNCLVAGTNIISTKGTTLIEDIKPGDSVVGFSVSNSSSVQQVSQVFERDYDDEIIHLELEDGNNIFITPNHKVLTQLRGWVQADELTTDDEVITINLEVNKECGTETKKLCSL